MIHPASISRNLSFSRAGPFRFFADWRGDESHEGEGGRQFSHLKPGEGGHPDFKKAVKRLGEKTSQPSGWVWVGLGMGLGRVGVGVRGVGRFGFGLGVGVGVLGGGSGG